MSDDAPAALLLGTLATLGPAALRWSPDSASAEDLLHDTAERALRKLDRFQVGSCARAWLVTIMYRLAIDAFRRMQSDRAMCSNYHAEVEVAARDSDDNGGEQAFSAQPPSSDELRAMAETLAEPFKSTFVLWAFDRLSYREISQRTGRPVGTVATRLMRARNALRAQFGLNQSGEMADGRSVVVARSTGQ